MADKNKTVFQNLNQMMNLDGTGYDVKEPQQNKRVVIRGNSPDEVKVKALEYQQQQAIQDKLFKVTDHGFQKAMQYEAARLPAYLDYEGMEYYPIIASALDLLMEEATTIGEDGQMLKIYSDKGRIKTHLEELFYDIVNVNVNLPFWTRNLVKYGDNFVYMLGEKKKGITVIKQMVNYEMERVERIHNGKSDVKFKQRETNDDFNIFEIAHFRLLGDDKYLPYGSSALNKIRRVFRQLIMAEDAMLTYRIIRAGEKRVFKIDVGNIDEDDIENYTTKIAARFKKQQQVHADSGQIDYRFNILGNDEDYIIPVRNANVQTGIDTLPGAQNLDQIQDIEYLRDNLFTGLGIPKPFLGFQEAAGDGKNMAQMDIRFSKKINRIQQAIIQELNKMAIIHLYLLGFSKDDLSNFTLSLTNPSTQQDLLKNELLQAKGQVYTEMTRSEGGIAAMSHTTAKKKILNMSEKEIIDDLKMQRMERAVSQELQDSPLVIRQTGLFDDVDAKYGTGEIPEASGDTGMEGMEGGMEMNEPPAGGGGMDAPQSPNELPAVIGQGQGFKSKKPIISEENYRKYGTRFDSFIEEMVTSNTPIKKKETTTKSIIKENDTINKKLNEKATQMANEIDDLLKENSDSINTKETVSSRNFETKKNSIDKTFNVMDIKINEGDLKSNGKKIDGKK